MTLGNHCALRSAGSKLSSVQAPGGKLMRYLAAALVMAFAVGAISTAQACPFMKNAATQTTVASSDGQGAQPSTKVRIPQPKG